MTTLSENVLTQYRAVRENRGFIDRTGAGLLAIRGADRFTWLQGMVSNDVKPLANNLVYVPLRACVLNATGHILTDLSLIPIRNRQHSKPLQSLLGMVEQEFLLADLPRANITKILELFDRYLITEEVEIRNVTEEVGCFSLQGRRAYEIWDFAQGSDDDPFKDIWNQITTYPSDHFGERGFDAYFPLEFKEGLLEAIRRSGVVEVGPEAQQILRVEAGIPQYGVDMDETTLAPEANLMATHISLTKGCYVGQEIVARIDSRGHTNRALTGLVVVEGDIPTQGDKIQTEQSAEEASRETGRITSVIAASPALDGRPIALGYVRHEHRAPGRRLRVESESATCVLEVAELPFYRKPVA